ncbi:hypothetical protein [Methylobacterium sp. J-090]|uniref:hypothetical protein n=1 Tax=Methylobacterium sp. J-090 TaxID=2836666 RepID=UPI001FB8B16F|nr:hypothetical protein [Methylobacterium sp. J-090]MCJ2081548.1 hypothetical protein [Methylobacterium sp. J-090]
MAKTKSKSKTKQQIAHPSTPELTEDIRLENFLKEVDLNELSEPPEPCSPFQCSPNEVAEVKLWNAGLARIDAQRSLPTIALQAEYMASIIEKAPYVLALVARQDEWTFFWVKGFDKAVGFGGDEQAIIDGEAIAFSMPSRDWAEFLMVGYGDCEASHQHRDKAIWDDGEGAVQGAREFVTLKATEGFHGHQPS